MLMKSQVIIQTEESHNQYCWCPALRKVPLIMIFIHFIRNMCRIAEVRFRLRNGLEPGTCSWQPLLTLYEERTFRFISAGYLKHWASGEQWDVVYLEVCGWQSAYEEYIKSICWITLLIERSHAKRWLRQPNQKLRNWQSKTQDSCRRFIGWCRSWMSKLPIMPFS